MSGDRKKIIERMLDEDGIVYIAELVKQFPDVSAMTIRRDLDYFEKQGLAVRIYGGAQKKTFGSEPYYSFRANKNRDIKTKIARLCLRHIGENATVFLDCGTTAMEIARALPNMPLSVVTNAPNIAIELSKRDGVAVTVLGGQLNRDNYSLSGRLTESMLESLNIDTAFVAASGLSKKSGFSCGNYNEKEVKTAVLKKAHKRIVIMDSTKFDKNMMFTFAGMADLDVFVTDRRPSDDIMLEAAERGVDVQFTL